MEFDGIVIDQVMVKEYDAMIKVLTPSGLVTFFARRALAQKSQDYAALQPFAFSHFVISEGPQAGLKLKQAELKTYLGFHFETLEQLLLLDLIKETIAHITLDGEEADFFDLVKDTVMKGKETNMALPGVLGYLLALLKMLGWGLLLDACAVCGTKKDIVGLDLSRGGFVCRAHYEETTSSALSKDRLMALNAFSNGPGHLKDVESSDQIALIRLVAQHYEDSTGRSLQSLKLLNI